MKYQAGWASKLLLGLIGLLLLTGTMATAWADSAPLSMIAGVDPAQLRWRDVALHDYASVYRTTYLYRDATVTVTWGVGGAPATLAGHLSAQNLKPNFAYQMKLEGKPTGRWGENGDDTANENIGFLGRWWRAEPSPGNSTDADYLAHRDDPNYVYLGYLVFEFFVTDQDGNAEVDFALDSSLFTLATDSQSTPGTCDTPLRWHEVVGSASDFAYASDVGPVDVGVYGRAVPDRPCAGEALLPPGPYPCRFILTEESFHETGVGSGNWASVMAYNELFFDTAAAPTLPDAHDYVDVGNPASEAGHALTGWGPIEPDTHGGTWGGLGAETPAGRCRAIWSDEEDAPVENWASLQMNFGISQTETKCLAFRYLDGGSDDSFRVTIDGAEVLVVSAPPTTETWHWATVDVTGYTGVHTIRFEATAPPGPFYDPYGQVGIDKLYIGTQVTAVPVDAQTIACGETKRVDFHLNLDCDDGPIRGYTVRVRCLASESVLAFDAADITVNVVPLSLAPGDYTWQVHRSPEAVGDNDWTIDYIILGDAALPDGLPGDRDLFSIDFHAMRQGTGQVIVESARVGLVPGGPAPAVGRTSTAVTVVCDPPTEVSETPAAFDLRANYPNPFNPVTQITFSLPEAQQASLLIYTLEGRRVATLRDGWLAAGPQTAVWSGRDDNGQLMPSGVYFCRLLAGKYERSLKMTLLK